MFRNEVGALLAAVIVLAGVVFPRAVHAQTGVAAGWDLFRTEDPTVFMGEPFRGVPLGSFDFGGTIGMQPVGSADTIVRRTADAIFPSTPGMDTVPIELVALQLVSVNPITIGTDTGHLFVTLQGTHGGPPSTGHLTITAHDGSGGTFDSFFDVFVEIHLGSLDGPIVQSGNGQFSSNGVRWDRTPPPGATTIDGVNRNLSGDDGHDFWPEGPFNVAGSLGVHRLGTAINPEPGSLALVLMGGLPLVGGVLRRRRR